MQSNSHKKCSNISQTITYYILQSIAGSVGEQSNLLILRASLHKRTITSSWKGIRCVMGWIYRPSWGEQSISECLNIRLLSGLPEVLTRPRTILVGAKQQKQQLYSHDYWASTVRLWAVGLTGAIRNMFAGHLKAKAKATHSQLELVLHSTHTHTLWGCTCVCVYWQVCEMAHMEGELTS